MENQNKKSIGPVKWADGLLNRFKITSLGARLLLLWLLSTYFMTAARFILHRLGLSSGPVRELILVIVSAIPLMTLAVNLKKLDKKQYVPGFCLIIFVGLLFLVTALLRPDIRPYLVREGYGIERVLRPDCAIYAFLFLCLVDDPEELYNTLFCFAVLDLIYILIVELAPAIARGCFEDINWKGETVKRGYSLAFGYDILLPASVMFFDYFRRRRVLPLIAGIVCVLLILIYGNRGAFFLSAAFILLMAVSRIIAADNKKLRLKRLLYTLLGIFAFFLFYKYFFRLLAYLLEIVHISSRTLSMAQEGNMADGTGRGEIWALVLDTIKQNGIFGGGVFADRPVIAPTKHYAGYSHNIVLELIVSFGIFGAAASAGLVYFAVRMIFFCRDTEWRELFILFFTVSCQLIMSMSLWYVMEFWAALGIVYKYYTLSKQGKAAGFVSCRSIRKPA